MVVIRRTGMPSSRARSVFSAAARIALPDQRALHEPGEQAHYDRDHCQREQVVPVELNGPDVDDELAQRASRNGARISGTSGKTRSESSSSTPPSNWARPIVATVRTSFGELANRRITANSTSRAHGQPQYRSCQEGDPVRDVPLLEAPHGRCSGHPGNREVGEVDHPVGPPHEDQPHRGEARGGAEHQTQQHDPQGKPLRQHRGGDRPCDEHAATTASQRPATPPGRANPGLRGVCCGSDPGPRPLRARRIRGPSSRGWQVGGAHRPTARG